MKNKTFRIRTNVGETDNVLNVNLTRDVELLEILSLKLNKSHTYHLMTSNSGVIIGRVIANGGFGIPNAKISVFIPISDIDSNDTILTSLYPYKTLQTRDKENRRYNLFPNYKKNSCYQVIGTFPEKRLILDNDTVLEVYEKYYKFTTVTNKSGDYMLFGVPNGQHELHVDLDLSDIGVLSQRPRDMIYKGYNINQFENGSQFKKSTDLDNLAQVFSQKQSVYVYPFWGDSEANQIAISRNDIHVDYKFEPTCVFMGSVVTDSGKAGLSKKCRPFPDMGKNSELITNSGVIEMIRKRPDGYVEQYNIQGNLLIDNDGVFCYQIPMNMDFVTTDEFGNTIPTDDPTKGIPTRTRARFRFTLDENDNDSASYHRAKFLFPNNVKLKEKEGKIELAEDLTFEDYYEFGSTTNDKLFVDMYWNQVYSIKSYIPRLQTFYGDDTKKYLGLKNVAYSEGNTSIPYNKISIKLNFMYMLLCLISKVVLKVLTFLNLVASLLRPEDSYDECVCTNHQVFNSTTAIPFVIDSEDKYVYIPGIRPRLNPEGEWSNKEKNSIFYCSIRNFAYRGTPTNSEDDCGGIAQMTRDDLRHKSYIYINENCYGNSKGDVRQNVNALPSGCGVYQNDYENGMAPMIFDDNEAGTIISGSKWYSNRIWPNRWKKVFNTPTLEDKIEQNLAADNQVVHLDFYNDWLNGSVYFPLWFRKKTRKKSFLGFSIEAKEKFCDCNNKSRLRVLDTCSVSYEMENDEVFNYKYENYDKSVKSSYQKKLNRGIVYRKVNKDNLNIYYYANFIKNDDNEIIPLFSTDIILLGSLNECDSDGIPQFFKYLTPTSVNLPPMGTLYENEDETGSTATTVEATGMDVTSKYLPGYAKGHLGNGFNGNATTAVMGDGLFMSLDCFGYNSFDKTCMNVSRLCELGVSTDMENETYASNGNLITLYADGLMTSNDINDFESRAMFATLNFGNLSFKVTDNKTGYDKYFFNYLSPQAFNGMGGNYLISADTTNTYSMLTKYTSNMSNMDSDFMDYDYMKFRFGKYYRFIDKDDDRYILPYFDNSYYFYFGLRDGNSALDKFNNIYYAPCPEDVIESDNVSLTVANNFSLRGFGDNENYNTEEEQNNVEVGVSRASQPIMFSLRRNQDNTVVSEGEQNNNVIETFSLNNINETEFNYTSEFDGTLDDGEYTLTIVDSNNHAYEKTFVIDTPKLVYTIEYENLKSKFIEGVTTSEYFIENELFGELCINSPSMNSYNVNITSVNQYSTNEFILTLDNNIKLSLKLSENYIDAILDKDNVFEFIENKIYFKFYKPIILTVDIDIIREIKDGIITMYDEHIEEFEVKFNNPKEINAFINEIPLKVLTNSNIGNYKSYKNDNFVKNQHFYNLNNEDDTEKWFKVNDITSYNFEDNFEYWDDIIDLKGNTLKGNETNIIAHKLKYLLDFSNLVYSTNDNLVTINVNLDRKDSKNRNINLTAYPYYYDVEDGLINSYNISTSNSILLNSLYPSIVGWNYKNYKGYPNNPFMNNFDNSYNLASVYYVNGEVNTYPGGVDYSLINNLGNQKELDVIERVYKTNERVVTERDYDNEYTILRKTYPFFGVKTIDRRIDYRLEFGFYDLHEEDKFSYVRGFLINGIEMGYDDNYVIVGDNDNYEYSISGDNITLNDGNKYFYKLNCNNIDIRDKVLNSNNYNSVDLGDIELENYDINILNGNFSIENYPTVRYIGFTQNEQDFIKLEMQNCSYNYEIDDDFKYITTPGSQENVTVYKSSIDTLEYTVVSGVLTSLNGVIDKNTNNIHNFALNSVKMHILGVNDISELAINFKKRGFNGIKDNIIKTFDVEDNVFSLNGDTINISDYKYLYLVSDFIYYANFDVNLGKTIKLITLSKEIVVKK